MIKNDFKQIGEIMPISALAGIDGEEMFDKIQSIFSSKQCCLLNKNGVNFRLLLISSKLIKSGAEITQDAICSNCRFCIPY